MDANTFTSTAMTYARKGDDQGLESFKNLSLAD
jgi:hypothetical protein